jgi:urea carboxylase
LKDYRAFLADNAGSITAFKTTQQEAFEAERDRWAQAGQAVYAGEADVAAASPDSELDLPAGARLVPTSVPGNVWQVAVTAGQQVKAGELLVIVESMKMEFSIHAPCDGRVHTLLCKEGSAVAAGQDVLVLIEAQ